MALPPCPAPITVKCSLSVSSDAYPPVIPECCARRSAFRKRPARLASTATQAPVDDARDDLPARQRGCCAAAAHPGCPQVTARASVAGSVQRIADARPGQRADGLQRDLRFRRPAVLARACTARVGGHIRRAAQRILDRPPRQPAGFDHILGGGGMMRPRCARPRGRCAAGAPSAGRRWPPGARAPQSGRAGS